MPYARRRFGRRRRIRRYGGRSRRFRSRGRRRFRSRRGSRAFRRPRVEAKHIDHRGFTANPLEPTQAANIVDAGPLSLLVHRRPQLGAGPGQLVGNVATVKFTSVQLNFSRYIWDGAGSGAVVFVWLIRVRDNTRFWWSTLTALQQFSEVFNLQSATGGFPPVANMQATRVSDGMSAIKIVRSKRIYWPQQYPYKENTEPGQYGQMSAAPRQIKSFTWRRRWRRGLRQRFGATATDSPANKNVYYILFNTVGFVEAPATPAFVTCDFRLYYSYYDN